MFIFPIHACALIQFTICKSYAAWMPIHLCLILNLGGWEANKMFHLIPLQKGIHVTLTYIHNPQSVLWMQMQNSHDIKEWLDCLWSMCLLNVLLFPSCRAGKVFWIACLLVWLKLLWFISWGRRNQDQNSDPCTPSCILYSLFFMLGSIPLFHQ